MPDYNIYYFVINPIRIKTGTGTTGTAITSPSRNSPVVQKIFADFRTNLINLMNQAKNYIPWPRTQNQTQAQARVARTQISINVIRINNLLDNSFVPDFSGLNIQMHEPILYFTTQNRAWNHEALPGQSTSALRRPECVMYEALRRARSQHFSQSTLDVIREAITSSPHLHGISFPGFSSSFVSFPVIANVFTDAMQNYGASNWQELMSKKFADAAFHEIAHCKAETDNRPPPSGRKWELAINSTDRDVNQRYQSIHDVPDVEILARVGLGEGTMPSAGDFRLMGEHMMCPINFYKLDQPIHNQCFQRGQIVPL